MQSFSRWFIDAYILCTKTGSKWRLTGFYRHPETTKREETWTLLESLSQLNDLPWLCVGDFNKILYHLEKHGGYPRPTRQMEHFHKTINMYELNDLGFFGSPFTWSKNHLSERRIHICLDHALANSAWNSSFQGATVHHLSRSTLDHSMLYVHLPSSKPRRRFIKPLFHFEAMWLRNPGYADVVQEAWLEGLNKPRWSPNHQLS